MNYTIALQQVKQQVQDYFEQSVPQPLPYHNLEHTAGVAKAAAELGNHYQLNEIDFFVVNAAAWFHDIGYYLGTASEHESNGAGYADTYLQQLGVPPAVITSVKDCILATRMPQQPSNLLEQIVCDADLFHLGTAEFADIDKKMRKEMALAKQQEINKSNWRAHTIQFLQSHHYHTQYAQLLLNEGKQLNLKKLLKKQAEKEPTLVQESSVQKATAGVDVDLSKTKKVERPVRGIETMFRVASTNHQRLSDMADSKAHIMISVNSIIISVVIGLVVRKLETAQNLIIPTLILLGGSVIAVIFSVLATRPKIPNGDFTSDQLANRSVNLLFFGNFYKMDFEHYYEGMQQVMADSDFLYGSLIRDIHSQGVVLGHKYKLLRVSYTIFMFTLIISVLAFAIATIFFE